MKNFKYLLIVLLLLGCSNQESPTISEKEESSSIIEESTLSESETDSIIESSSKQEESTSEEEWPYGNLLLDPSSIEFSFTQENIVDDVLVGSTYDSFLKNASSSELVIPALNQYFVPQGISY